MWLPYYDNIIFIYLEVALVVPDCPGSDVIGGGELIGPNGLKLVAEHTRREDGPYRRLFASVL